MDYLKSTFFEALSQEQNSFVANGRIYVRTHHWAPEDVLQTMLTKEAFAGAFDDWVAERKEDLIAQSDDILQQFSTEDRFKALTEAYKQDAVVPFVGAGLSMPSKYPGWSAFLRTQRRDTGISETLLEELLMTGQYEEAAEVLANNLGAGFNEAVYNAFGISREIFGCVQYLPYVFNTSVVTTNFDDVLKRCYENAGTAFTETISGGRVTELPRIISAGTKVLVKLHGTATSGSARILTKSEYDSHYVTRNDLKRSIKAVCNRTLLFIGCSLSVDRTLGVMKEIVSEEGHDNTTRHYAFIEDPGSSVARNERRVQLLACNIYPIWYPSGDHDASVEAFLAKLAASNE
jgi:hypothetical protein